MNRKVIYVAGDPFTTGNSINHSPNCPLGPAPTKEVKRQRNKQIRQKSKACLRDYEDEDNFPINQVGACKKLANVMWDRPAPIFGNGRESYIIEWMSYERKNNPTMSDAEIREKLKEEYNDLFAGKR